MHSILKMTVLGCALLMATPLFVTGDDQPAKGERHGKRGDMMEGTLAKLNLTEDQKTKIDAIKAKFQKERQELEKTHKSDVDAAKQAKDQENPREIMKRKRKAMMNEIKGVLTDEQKEQFQKAMEASHGDHGDKK